MAKKDSRLGDDPFDLFLPQIKDSRKKKDVDISNDGIKNTDKNKNVIIDNDENANVNNDTNINVNNDEDVNDGSNINSSTDSISDVSTAVSKNTNADNDVAVSETITINKKKFKSGEYVRATYYLRPDQIRTINRLNRDSGQDKSELVRMALDILFERARVE